MALDEIIAAKRAFIANLEVCHPREDGDPARRCRSLDSCLRRNDSLSVIAELKSKSPSEGVIKVDYDPVALAKEYVKGGAAAISVLTDESFFGGSFSHLQAVRAAVDVPLLCKDFILDEKQVFLAHQNGADAVLLIVRILTLEQLRHLKAVIESLDMLPLIEIFDEADLEIALQVDPKILLVNNRNLDSLQLNMHNTSSLLDFIPEGIEVIAASGMKVPTDVQKYPERVRAVLVGTMLMKAENPAALIREMIACRA